MFLQNRKHRFVVTASLNLAKSAIADGKRTAKMRVVSLKGDMLRPKNRRVD